MVDGVPQAMAPAIRTYGAIQAELACLITRHLIERSSCCTVVKAPGIIPHARGQDNLRIPDLAAFAPG
ncbi:MAG: hypothetical protein JOY71_22555 [Acetobacteraceae bacterium]|nr:hypothetical protein [Acetobacteraceae bacterium]MBV8524863.1 hypothetical protein [Acetobacteraceae bacterium]